MLHNKHQINILSHLWDFALQSISEEGKHLQELLHWFCNYMIRRYSVTNLLKHIILCILHWINFISFSPLHLLKSIEVYWRTLCASGESGVCMWKSVNTWSSVQILGHVGVHWGMGVQVRALAQGCMFAKKFVMVVLCSIWCSVFWNTVNALELGWWDRVASWSVIACGK